MGGKGGNVGVEVGVKLDQLSHALAAAQAETARREAEARTRAEADQAASEAREEQARADAAQREQEARVRHEALEAQLAAAEQRRADDEEAHRQEVVGLREAMRAEAAATRAAGKEEGQKLFDAMACEVSFKCGRDELALLFAQVEVVVHLPQQQPVRLLISQSLHAAGAQHQQHNRKCQDSAKGANRLRLV